MAGSISDMKFTYTTTGADASSSFSLDSTYAWEGTQSLKFTDTTIPCGAFPTTATNTDATGGLIRMRHMITDYSTRTANSWSRVGPWAMFQDSADTEYGIIFAAYQNLPGTDDASNYVYFDMRTVDNSGSCQVLNNSETSPYYYITESGKTNPKFSDQDWITLELRWEYIDSSYISGTDNYLAYDGRVYNADMSDLIWQTAGITDEISVRTSGLTGMFFQLGNSGVDTWVDYFESYKV